jgi:CRISPR/Cas system CSM-associated protein Csm3 (group 7 of RAMP superfamily)
VFDTDIRDGVKINGDSRTADEGALFSFRVWAAGTRFPLRLELNLPDTLSAEVLEDLYASFVLALTGLDDGSIRLGARKHRGYGRFHMENWRASEYDMTSPGDLVDWLMVGDKPPAGEGVSKIAEISWLPVIELDARQFVRMDATFALIDNLLIRADSDVAGMAHLMGRRVEGPQAVLSGTSVAGAIRARALKIAKRLLGNEDGIHLIDQMFGRHGSNNAEEEDMTASRVIVEEHQFTGGITDVVQNRVKIDRFTGGAYETGLFDQQPLFAGAQEETLVNINLELRIPHHLDAVQADFEIALLLLLLKDAWTGDLPFGGESSVGRGRLAGRRAEIQIKRDKHVTCYIEAVEGGLVIENRELLQSYEAALGQFAE